jgi:hypothetical protein
MHAKMCQVSMSEVAVMRSVLSLRLRAHGVRTLTQGGALTSLRGFAFNGDMSLITAVHARRQSPRYSLERRSDPRQ